MDANLTHVLVLAKAAFEARDSSLWARDLDAASEAYGEACEAVWDELERLVNEGNVRQLPSPAQVRASVRNAAIKHLQERLPDVVSDILAELR